MSVVGFSCSSAAKQCVILVVLMINGLLIAGCEQVKQDDSLKIVQVAQVSESKDNQEEISSPEVDEIPEPQIDVWISSAANERRQNLDLRIHTAPDRVYQPVIKQVPSYLDVRYSLKERYRNGFRLLCKKTIWAERCGPLNEWDEKLTNGFSTRLETIQSHLRKIRLEVLGALTEKEQAALDGVQTEQGTQAPLSLSN